MDTIEPGDGREMVYIDGAEGEGGGQVLRSSLALSVCLQKPFRIENIRAKRKKPGLLRQHLTCVKAAARISNATVVGDRLGSQCLQFEPNPAQAGEYHFAISTAGSTTLVLQTILIPLLLASGKSRVIIEGGTHNPMAPPYEFIRHAYLPVLRKMGAKLDLSLDRPGFFPKGGGRIVVEVDSIAQLKHLGLNDRGKILGVNGNIFIAGLPLDIAEREIGVLARKLKTGKNEFDIQAFGVEYGPANVVSVVVNSENVCEVFTGFGQKGVRAEIVAKRVADRIKSYIKCNVATDEHLADQLLLPMALAGSGSFVTNVLSGHTQTNMSTIRKFLKVSFSVLELGDTQLKVSIGKSEQLDGG